MNYNKKGFTLIELMIVIAIIGVLAVTLVPQLTGAQARARDTGRIQNVASTRAVLETYYSDEWKFPEGENWNTCLSGANGKIADSNSDLRDLFGKGTAPVDPQAGNISEPCQTGGVLGYKRLMKNDTPDSSYLIVTNLETDKKANTRLTKAAAAQNDYEELAKVVWQEPADKNYGTGLESVYAELY